jgi:hypothetical protein
LFQGGRRDSFPELVASLSFMISLLARTDQLATAASRQWIIVGFRAKSVEPQLLPAVDRDAIDPIRTPSVHRSIPGNVH